MKTRVEHIDIAKGISIILVAIYHSKLNMFAPDIISSMGLFRVPLFFFLSGIFFSNSSNVLEFFGKKADALLKPYFATLLFVAVITILFKQEYLTWQLKGIFYGNGDTLKWIGQWVPMWFLTHLFSVYAFTYFAFRLTNIQENNIYYKCLFITILLAVGSQLIDVFWYLKIILLGKEIELPGLPFSLDLVLISSSFFIAGSFLRKRVVNFNPNFYILSASVLIFFIVSIFTDASIALNRRVYVNPLMSTIGAISGTYFILYISFYFKKLSILRKIFLTFGQSSLFILIFHDFIGSLVYENLSGLDKNNLEVYIVITAFLISILTPLIIKHIVLKNKLLSFVYFPLKSKKSVTQN